MFTALNVGNGLMIYPSGKIYEGEWVFKRRHGYGILKKRNRKPVEGRWINNQILEEGNDSFVVTDA